MNKTISQLPPIEQLRTSSGLKVTHKVTDKTGTILAHTDPRAWAHTIKFPTEHPDPQAVIQHVQQCYTHHLLQDTVPVLWDSGECYWHKPTALKLSLA